MMTANYMTVADDDPPPTNASCHDCQSVVTEPQYEGACNCCQRLLEIRCEGLTSVPRFRRLDCLLAVVYMANQSIRSLEADAFANLPTRRLVLNFNGLDDRLAAGAFGGNLSAAVEELYLGACRLRALPPGLFDGMVNLTVLHLWHNFLRRIPPRLFSGCENLRELILSNNVIASLEPNTFDGLRRLRKLDLDSNDISALSQDVFNGLANLQVSLQVIQFILERKEDADLKSVATLQNIVSKYFHKFHVFVHVENNIEKFYRLLF